MHHDLKIWPEFFAVVERGDKPFEVRRNDRAFAVGDTLVLREWQRVGGDGHYTGRETEKIVTYVMRGGSFGIDPEFAVLGIR